MMIGVLLKCPRAPEGFVTARRYRVGDIEVDTEAFRATRHGQPLSLEPKAFDVLRVFIERPNQLITRRELLDAVWKDVAVTENALARAVTILRKALGDNADFGLTLM